MQLELAQYSQQISSALGIDLVISKLYLKRVVIKCNDAKSRIAFRNIKQKAYDFKAKINITRRSKDEEMCF